MTLILEVILSVDSMNHRMGRERPGICPGKLAEEMGTVRIDGSLQLDWRTPRASNEHPLFILGLGWSCGEMLHAGLIGALPQDQVSQLPPEKSLHLEVLGKDGSGLDPSVRLKQKGVN